MASPSEKPKSPTEDSPATKELLHKTKLIQFLGRSTPIVLQNDNGPCPLLAICNVLLLRNNLNLSSDVAEVSQEKLLSLVAERLIDSNSNVNNKDAGFVENQQQNISDAIDLLPRLATGIDVNIKFTRIDDFEFTRECAIFDLLDIPLYHGWIVDPQDSDTSSAIGTKSYNTLMGELVDLETQNLASDSKKNSEEDSVDFVAATTASLGVPSPSLSKSKSFDDSPRSASEEQKERKGDLIEEEELLRALKLSETDNSPSATDVNVVITVDNNLSGNSNTGDEVHGSCRQQPSTADDSNVMNHHAHVLITSETVPGPDVCSSERNKDKLHGQIEEPSEKHNSKDEIASSDADKDRIHDQIDAPYEKQDSNNEIKETSADLSEKHDSRESRDEIASSEGGNGKLHGQIDTPSEKRDSNDEMDKTCADVSEKFASKDEIASSEIDKDEHNGQIHTQSEKHNSNDEIEKTGIESRVYYGKDEIVSSEGDKDNLHGQTDTLSRKHDSKDEIETTSVDEVVQSEKATRSSDGSNPPPPVNIAVHDSGDENIQDQSVLTTGSNEIENIKSVGETSDLSCSSAPTAVSESSKDIAQTIDESKSLTSRADGSEPIYEGEECIETGTKTYEDREPMYEGEVVLAGQVDKVSNSAGDTKSKVGISPRQGELIRNFLKNSASQLTIYGLFSLQDGLKERELCVFFRNNHFNTMFKFEGELYLLATDQGYINQPDLVWEKLNEVNGDTVFMTGNFKEFKVDDHETRSWDEQNALANTADYLASIDNSAQENTNFNSDLQLAIALQQQEFDQQQQPQRNSQPSTASGASRLVTGPQNVQPSRPRNSSPSPKPESKSAKDKCTVM